MATLAPPGVYAAQQPSVISTTESFTGRARTITLVSPLYRDIYTRFGYMPEHMKPTPGLSRRAGSFGQRRGRRFLSPEIV
jgi:hypothetical protein